MTKVTANHRYKIRTFEARDGSRRLSAGTIVMPKDGAFALHAASVEQVEQILCEYVQSGKLLSGHIYQICPLIGNPEAIRFVSICDQGRARRIALDATMGMHSVLRSIRDCARPVRVEEPALQEEAVPA